MTTDKRQDILQAGRAMVQAHGYNALSFREIAKAVGVKSSSVHYHFPTKGDLGAALARQYTKDGVTYLASLDAAGLDVSTLIQRYTDIFRSALVNDNRMCLCGIMVAEHEGLPPEVRVEVDAFTDANVQWLARVLAATMPEAKPSEIEQRALAIFAAIEGAQLVARGRADVRVFDGILESYRKAGCLP